MNIDSMLGPQRIDVDSKTNVREETRRSGDGLCRPIRR